MPDRPIPEAMHVHAPRPCCPSCGTVPEIAEIMPLVLMCAQCGQWFTIEVEVHPCTYTTRALATEGPT